MEVCGGKEVGWRVWGGGLVRDWRGLGGGAREAHLLLDREVSYGA